MVTGGFAEANPTGLTVLANSATAVDDLDRGVLAGQIKDLEEDVADATEGPARDRAAHKLDQLKAVQAALGSDCLSVSLRPDCRPRDPPTPKATAG